MNNPFNDEGEKMYNEYLRQETEGRDEIKGGCFNPSSQEETKPMTINEVNAVLKGLLSEIHPNHVIEYINDWEVFNNKHNLINTLLKAEFSKRGHLIEQADIAEIGKEVLGLSTNTNDSYGEFIGTMTNDIQADKHVKTDKPELTLSEELSRNQHTNEIAKRISSISYDLNELNQEKARLSKYLLHKIVEELELGSDTYLETDIDIAPHVTASSAPFNLKEEFLISVTLKNLVTNETELYSIIT